MRQLWEYVKRGNYDEPATIFDSRYLNLNADGV